eukprot:429772_1
MFSKLTRKIALVRRFCSVTKCNNNNNLGPMPDDFLKHFASFQLISYLRECQQLKILDILPEEENSTNLLSIEEISKQCNAKDPQNIYRTLRFLSFFGYTKQISVNDKYYFVHTDLSKQYAINPTTKQPYNLCSYFGFATYSHPIVMQPFIQNSTLNEWILNNKIPFEHCHGFPLFGANGLVEQKDNKLAQQFVSVLWPFYQHIGLRTMNDISNNFDFSPYRTICDIGGGMGQMCAPILNKYENMQKAVIFDTENIIHQAIQQSENIFGNINMSKVEYISGDFFKTINVCKNIDIYLLRWILHDWTDDECCQIIANIRKSINESNDSIQSKRVLIVESLIKDINYEAMDVNPTNLLDLNILHYDMILGVFTNGKERTLLEYDDIMMKGGNFERVAIQPMGLWNVIEYKSVL